MARIEDAFSLSAESSTHSRPEGEGTPDVALPHVGQTADAQDEAREKQIKSAGAAMQCAYWLYEETGCFAALGDAHRLQKEMADLIRGRSAQYVAQLEQERGLSGR